MNKTVIHLVEAFAGGVYEVVKNLANHQVSNGWDVYVVYSERDCTPESVNSEFDDSVNFIPLEMCRNIKLSKDLRSFFEVRKVFKRIKPDVIHLHSSKAGFLGRAAALHMKGGGRPRVFYSPHGLSFLREDIGVAHKIIYVLAEKIAALFGGNIIACSDSELEQIRRWITTKNIGVVDNAIFVTQVSDIKNHEKCNGCSVIVATAGRISFQKNPILFSKIAKRMRDIFHGGVSFVWIGGGEDDVSNELLKRSGVDVTGWLSRDKAVDELSMADIYLQTSIWEGMPLTLIEAAAAGLPAVVTNVTGNKDVVNDGVTGYVCDNEEEVISSLGKLIVSGVLREKMGRAARMRALERFNVPRMLERYDELYGSGGGG